MRTIQVHLHFTYLRSKLRLQLYGTGAERCTQGPGTVWCGLKSWMAQERAGRDGAKGPAVLRARRAVCAENSWLHLVCRCLKGNLPICCVPHIGDMIGFIFVWRGRVLTALLSFSERGPFRGCNASSPSSISLVHLPFRRRSWAPCWKMLPRVKASRWFTIWGTFSPFADWHFRNLEAAALHASSPSALLPPFSPGIAFGVDVFKWALFVFLAV